MYCTRSAILGALADPPAFAQVSSVLLSQDATEKIAPRQLGPIRDRLDHFDGTSDSTNWSGYAVLGTSFTSAEGSWGRAGSQLQRRAGGPIRRILGGPGMGIS